MLPNLAQGATKTMIGEAPDLVVPSAQEMAQAQETIRTLATVVKGEAPVPVRFGTGPNETGVLELPAAAVRLLLDLLEEMALGNAVALTPVATEVTSEEAARLLNVSNTHLSQLFAGGRLPHRKVGDRIFVTIRDIIKFRNEVKQKKRIALDELTAYDQELGLQ